MLFPESDKEVKYKNPILRQVICQFRFPTILSINESSPVEFQEEIRSVFPGLDENIEHDIQFQISPQFNTQQKPIFSDQSLFRKKKFRFYNKEDNYSISLTDRFLSFTSISYASWKEFSEIIINPLDHFLGIYKPAFFERIGLRYINLINRKMLSIEDSKLVELLKPEIVNSLGLIKDNEILLRDFTSDIRFNLDANEPDLFMHVLNKLVTDPIDGERNSLLFDYDIYSEK